MKGKLFQTSPPNSSQLSLLTPQKKQTIFNMTNINKGTMNMAAPSKSNLPFSYFSSFSLSTALFVVYQKKTALFVNLKFTLFLLKHFMMASKNPNKHPEIDLIMYILCSFHQFLIEPSLERTSYKCWKREDM